MDSPNTTTSSTLSAAQLSTTERTHMAWSPEWQLLSRGDLLLVLDRLGGAYALLAGELRTTWWIPSE